MKGDFSVRILRITFMLIISFLIIGVSFAYYVNNDEIKEYKQENDVNEANDGAGNEKVEELVDEMSGPTFEELNFISEEEKAKRRQDYLETNEECYTKEPDKFKGDVLEEYQEIADKYEHFYGWIKIDGTKIDDPVMYTPWYQDYYLDKDLDGKYLKPGTLFISQDSVFYPNYSNIIIHGHNMKNQTMFGSLKRYNNKSYYDTHKIIHFDTKYEKADYIVVAAFYARVLFVREEGFRYYRHDYFNDIEEFDDYIENIKKMRLYDTGIEVEYGDNLITLSTCSYHTENGRFVVVAKKMTPEEMEQYKNTQAN